MAPKLYYLETGPAARAVVLAVKALGMELQLVPVNMDAGEHLKPEYLKRPIFRQGVTTIPKEKQDSMIQIYDFLEAFLDGHNYIAGDNLTIADFCIVSVISTIAQIIPFTEKHPRLSAWFGRLKTLSYYKEANQDGADELAALIKSKLA